MFSINFIEINLFFKNIIDNTYNIFFINNNLYIIETYTTPKMYNIIYFFTVLKFLVKTTFVAYLITTVLIVINFKTFINQKNIITYTVKLFLLNNTEKDIGPVDDYFFFVVLFGLCISLFIFSAVSLTVIQFNMFNLIIGALLLLVFLILTIPVNLFVDFGMYFCTIIRGSAITNNIIKELIFDIVSTSTVFIRFIIQNIRFLFIFSGIFELME